MFCATMQCDCVVLDGGQLHRRFNKTTELSKFGGWHLHGDEHLPGNAVHMVHVIFLTSHN